MQRGVLTCGFKYNDGFHTVNCKAFQKTCARLSFACASSLLGAQCLFTICLFLQFVLFYNSYVFRSLSVCSKICSCLPDCFVRRCKFVVFAVLSCVRRGLHRIFLAKCEKILLENFHLCYNKYVMGRVMALDVGDVRIGVAVSDLMGIIANPLETYTRKGDVAKDAIYIANLAKQHEVDLFVCGLPLGLNGKENEQTQKTRAFIEELQKHTEILVRFMDERFTTLSAERVLIEGNVRRENRKKVIDKVAATIILQNYLDSKR